MKEKGITHWPMRDEKAMVNDKKKQKVEVCLVDCVRALVWMGLFICAGGIAQAGPVVVRQIEIRGAQAIPAAEVRAHLALRSGAVFDSLLARRDVDRVLGFYRDRGFWQVAVALPQVLVQEEHVRVVFEVVEGRRTRVDSVNLAGDLIFSEHEVRAAFGFAPGGVLIARDLSARLNGLLQFYENRGYPFCELHPDVRFVDGGARVQVSVAVLPGSLVYVDTVRFAGNRVTRPGVLLRQLGLVPGEVYRQQRVDHAVRRLRRLPFLLHVDAPELVREGDRTVLLIHVREARSARLDGVIGLAPDGEGQVVTGAVALDVQNVAGAGREGHVGWVRTGPGASDMALRYREPWMMGGPVSGRMRVVMRERTGYAEQMIALGADVSVADGAVLFVDGGRSRVVPDSMGFGRFLLSDAWMLEAGVVVDRRDDVWNPRLGWQGRAQVALHRVARALDEVVQKRYAVSGQGFVPVGMRATLMLGGQALWVHQPGGVPEEALWRLGGAETIRGYREEAFLATGAAWATVEWRVSFGSRSRVFAFVDAGMVKAAWRVFPVGYGIGLLAESRLGAIGLDFGLSRGNSPGEGQVHVRWISEF